MRDNLWLKEMLELVWQKYFSDIPRLNNVHIKFGRKAKRRLASIRQVKRGEKHSDTEIFVTSFYKDLRVPEYVVETTLAHELCHYAHGFASPLPQFSRYPHKGELVDNELKKRGLGSKLKNQEVWLKEEWNKIVGTQIFRRRSRGTRCKSSNNFQRLIRILGF